MRRWLRRIPLWIRFQELNREGWGRAFRRCRLQSPILATAPVRTSRRGPVEVRALTWRKDWVNLIWTLKTFYRFAQVDFPLFIHDGGLTRRQADRLQQHFPDATIVTRSDADERITSHLSSRGLSRCFDFRMRSHFGRKLFDYFVFSESERIISLDSDVLFFRRPSELIDRPNEARRNLFNRDRDDWYCLDPDGMEATFGVRPMPRINSGISSIWCESLDLRRIEAWLAEPVIHEMAWLTEQTLHAMSSTVYGVELLPSTYALGDTTVPIEKRVCHHYPCASRHRMYEEGMTYLVENGLFDSLAAGCCSRVA